MEAREYRNRPEAGKRYLLLSVRSTAILLASAYFIYLVDPGHEFWLLVMVLITTGLFLKDRGDDRRMVARPACRLTDEFIVFDHDRNVIPWSTITRVLPNTRKKQVKIWYSVTKEPSQKSSEDCAFIRGKWMQDWDSFCDDLRIECQKRSIEFIIQTNSILG